MKRKLILAAAIFLVFSLALAGQNQAGKLGLLLESLDQVIKLVSADNAIMRETKLVANNLKNFAKDAILAAKEARLNRDVEDASEQLNLSWTLFFDAFNRALSMPAVGPVSADSQYDEALKKCARALTSLEWLQAKIVALQGESSINSAVQFPPASRQSMGELMARIRREGAVMRSALAGKLKSQAVPPVPEAQWIAANRQGLHSLPAGQYSLLLQISGQYQGVIADICARIRVIKKNLPVAVQQKAMPVIQRVRGFRRSHPGSFDSLNCSFSEVRSVFGSRPANVENILACYVFGMAVGCGETDWASREKQTELAGAMMENGKAGAESAKEEMKVAMRMLREIEAEREKLVTLLTQI